MRIIAIVGAKNTGKTTLVTKIIGELVKRGFRVGTVKHSHHGFDMKHKDTGKHREAGAEIVVGLDDETFFTLKDVMGIEDVLSLIKFIKSPDFVVLEGFKNIKYAKISTSDFKDDFTIKQVSVWKMNDEDVRSLVDLIGDGSFGMLQNFNCKKCGFENCQEFVQAKLSGKGGAEVTCKTESDEVLLKIDNHMIPLNPFVRSFLKETVKGMVDTLKTDEFGVKELQKIELMIRNENNR